MKTREQIEERIIILKQARERCQQYANGEIASGEPIPYSVGSALRLRDNIDSKLRLLQWVLDEGDDDES